MKSYILLLLCIFSPELCGEGFVAGTQVKMPSGYVSIESLDVGDTVSCFDDELRLTSSSIVAIKKQQVDKVVEVYFDGEVIGAGLEQHFLLPSVQDPYGNQPLEVSHEVVVEVNGKKEVVSADYSQLVPLFSARKSMHALSGLKCIEKTVLVYSISLEKHHNYFVTKSDILAHNFALTIPILTWGAGGLSWAGISTIVGAVVAAVSQEIFINVMDFLARKTGPKKEQPTGNSNNSGPNKGPGKGDAIGVALALGQKTKEVIESGIDKLKYTAETFQSSLDYALIKNNIDHLIQQPKHNLDKLSHMFHNDNTKIAKAILKAAEGVAPSKGIFTAQVAVRDFEFTLSGRVMDGILKIGTAFKP